MSGKVGWPLGRPRSEESKAKLREHMLSRWQDPAYREKHTARLRAQRRTGRPSILPPRGTPERAQYNKARVILGVKAAREAMGLPA